MNMWKGLPELKGESAAVDALAGLPTSRDLSSGPHFWSLKWAGRFATRRALSADDLAHVDPFLRSRPVIVHRYASLEPKSKKSAVTWAAMG